MDPIMKMRFLREQAELERVSPKMESWRRPAQFKLAVGGRASGAKSWGAISLAVQEAHRQRKRIACLREFQKSLEESAYALFRDTIGRLRYPRWKVTKESLDSPTGSHIIFRGLKDYHHSTQAKGLEGFDIFLLEEASAISKESLSILLPTLFRTKGSELWAVWNREEDPDPIDELIWNRDYQSIIRVEMQPGPIDNPWWNPELQKLMDADYQYDPDLAAHVWGGEPRKQGQRAVMSRVAVEAAMKRAVDPEGAFDAGVDVARFGDDRSVGYLRQGFKVINSFNVHGFDTNAVASRVWDLVEHRPDTLIKIDAGYNPGVIDCVRRLGGKVMEVNFGSTAIKSDRYKSCADEMWFEFPVNEASIPNDPDLKRELCGRLYDYERGTERKVIESKAEYKKRLGRSPDLADALLLAYYGGGNGLMISNQSRAELAQRRGR